jgi:hypothetical protein
MSSSSKRLFAKSIADELQDVLFRKGEALVHGGAVHGCKGILLGRGQALKQRVERVLRGLMVALVLAILDVGGGDEGCDVFNVLDQRALGGWRTLLLSLEGAACGRVACEAGSTRVLAGAARGL